MNRYAPSVGRTDRDTATLVDGNALPAVASTCGQLSEEGYARSREPTHTISQRAPHRA